MALDRSRLSHLDEQLSQLQSNKNSVDVIKHTQESLADLFEHSTVTSSDLDKISDIKKLLSQKNSPKLQQEIDLLTKIENAIHEVKNRSLPDRSLDDHHGMTIENSLLTNLEGTFDHMQIKSFAYTSNNETVTGSISLDGKRSKTLTKAQTIAIYYTDENKQQTKIGTLLYNPKNTRLNFDESTLKELGIESIKFATNTTFSLPVGATLQNQKTHTIQTGSTKKTGTKTGGSSSSGSTGGGSKGTKTTTGPTTPTTPNHTIHTEPQHNTTTNQTLNAQVNNNTSAITQLQSQLQAMQSSNNNNININGMGGIGAGLHMLPGFTQLPPSHQLGYTTNTINNTQKKLSQKIKKIQKTIKKTQEEYIKQATAQGADIDTIKKQLSKLNEIEENLKKTNEETQKKFETLEKNLEGFIKGMDERDKNLAASINEKFQEKVQDIADTFDQVIEKQNTKLDNAINNLNKKQDGFADKMKEMFDNLKQDLLKTNNNKEKDEEIEDLKKKIKELEQKLKDKEAEGPDSGPTITPPAITSTDDVTYHTLQDISNTLTIDAHVMDKKSLVKKSIEQDVLNEYQHKYAKQMYIQRMGTYMRGRITQNNRIKKRTKNAIKNNESIEHNTKLQQRIASSIGTFAAENDYGVDEGTVQKTAIGSHPKVNAIANKYIQDGDREAAARNFNDFFKNNPDFTAGEMNGTDIMEQLDDLALMTQIDPFIDSERSKITTNDKNNIKNTMQKFLSFHPTCKLHNIHVANPSNITDAEIDRIIDYVVYMRSKAAGDTLQNITANIQLYKIEKETVELTESDLDKGNHKPWDIVHAVGDGLARVGALGTRGRAGYKIALGAGLAAGGVGTLGVVGGVAALAATLQRFKTHRDYLTEAQKTHEDAITMGTAELDKRIKALEKQIDKHTARQKAAARLGYGKHAIRTKQLNILNAVNDKMHKSGSIKPAFEVIHDLQNTNDTHRAQAIGETLARLHLGRELSTNLISGSERGLTEQERKDVMLQLRSAGIERAKRNFPPQYFHLIPDFNAGKHKRHDFWVYMRKNTTIKNAYDQSEETIQENYDRMRDDIRRGRRRIAWRDTGTNLATSALVAGTVAGASTLFGGEGWISGKDATDTTVHHQYDLGKFDHTNTATSTDLSDPLFSTKVGAGDTISIEGEAAVDAISASTGSFGNPAKELASLDSYIGTHFSDPNTVKTMQNGLRDGLAEIQKEALKIGADAGNVELVQSRWLDGAESLINKLHTATGGNIHVDNFKIDFNIEKLMDIQKSLPPGSGLEAQDIIDRAVAFDVKVDGTRGHWDIGDPLRVVRPGFSNTYAKPGKKKTMNDSRSKSIK